MGNTAHESLVQGYEALSRGFRPEEKGSTVFRRLMFSLVALGMLMAMPASAAGFDLSAVRQAAKAGDPQAMYDLGMWYYEGEGNAYAYAHEWLTKAAKKGRASAQYRLGWMYERSEWVQQNEDTAVSWYRQAADQGHPGARYVIGWRHRYGQNVKKDVKAAYQLLKLAAFEGNLPALSNLGELYLHGDGVKQDRAKARAMFRQADKLGHPEAEMAIREMDAEGR